MKRYYCTYFDKNYLVRGVALITSLSAHESQRFTIYVVCLDEITRLTLVKLKLRNVILIPLQQLEQKDVRLLAAKQNRSLVEYYWTITPTIILRLIELYPEIDLLTYLDADLFFFSSPDPIFDELSDKSVLIHEHRFPLELQYLAIYGKYNVGLLSFRRDENAIAVLNWWRDRCNEWCYDYIEDGKYGDQLYLDYWIKYFAGIQVLQYVGAGLAPWNQIQYSYTWQNDKLFVDGLPVVFYHFHGFDFFTPDVIVLSKHGYTLAKCVVMSCYRSYINQLSVIIEMIRSVFPGFDFGLASSGVLKDSLGFVIRKEFVGLVEHLASDSELITLDDSWACYCSKQIV